MLRLACELLEYSKNKLDILIKHMFIISMQVSEIVRDTIDKYLENHSKTKSSFSSWKPVSLGGLKTGAKDWITKDYQDEMLSSVF